MASKNSEESISESVYRRIFGVQVGDFIHFKYGKATWEVLKIEEDNKFVNLRRQKYRRGHFSFPIPEWEYQGLLMDELFRMNFRIVKRYNE